MGLFKVFAKVVSAPQMLVASMAKKVGSILSQSPSFGVMKIGISIESFGDSLTPRCYREEEKTVSSVINVEKDCTSYYNQAKAALTPALEKHLVNERTRINQCKESIQWVVPDDVFAGIKAGIPADPFAEICKSCWDEISVKISMDNEAFLDCLKVFNPASRREKCRTYVTNTVNEIAQNAGHRISEKANELIRKMLEGVEYYLVGQERLLREKEEELKVMNEKQSDPEFVSQQMIRTIVDIAFLSCIENANN